ncbi:MAG TPA: penicillin-binding protein 2 [Fimbriimonadaceae bacterium]|jgi:cell division protein FtsI/penicillin-binding protein 2
MSRPDKRLTILSRVVVGGFVIAALSQAKVQILQRNSIIDKATETDRFIISRADPAKRGIIYTADGKPLAEDEDTRVLNVDFTKVPHTPAFFMDVSAATGIPASEFQQLADSGMKTRTWRQPISSAQADQLQQVKTSWRADGISLAPSGRRTYPLADATSSFVGVLRDGKPQGGLESGDNKILAGSNGKKVGLVDREGHFLPMRLDSKTVQRVDGEDVTLTIDSQLQTAASNAIRQAVESNKATQGVAIVINPRNGDLVAMANWPSFDPNSLGEAEAAQQKYGFNPNYMAVLEPGSMFKILTLAKAFDCGAVKETDGVYCHGELAVGRRTVKCDSHHGNRAHGLLSPAMAIAKSCNVSAATWALRIGYDDYVKYLEQLGIMSKPNLGVPGERPGLFNYNDPAQELHLANLGFGQAINATPIQLAGAFGMLANNGMRMQPRLIKRIGNKDLAPVQLGQIVKQETTQKMLKIMQLVIESDAGTGKDLRIPGYLLGGKTGTAQKVNAKTHSMKGGGYVANFVGFVPGDKPQYVILVMVDDPTAGKYYGASVAGPVFKELAMDVINRFNIRPNAPFTKTAPIDIDQYKNQVTQVITAPYVSAQQIKEEIRAREDARAKQKDPIAALTNLDPLSLNADMKVTAVKKMNTEDPVKLLSTTPGADLLAMQNDADEPGSITESTSRGHRHHRHRRTEGVAAPQ